MERNRCGGQGHEGARCGSPPASWQPSGGHPHRPAPPRWGQREQLAAGQAPWAGLWKENRRHRAEGFLSFHPGLKRGRGVGWGIGEASCEGVRRGRSGLAALPSEPEVGAALCLRGPAGLEEGRLPSGPTWPGATRGEGAGELGACLVPQILAARRRDWCSLWAR